MTSILTNSSSLVALQTLRSINASLSKTQDEISTGKSIATAKDGSSLWAISKVMESDVSGFKTISSSLALGQSTVAVARQASETVTKLLNDVKAKIIAAQGSNVDRSKLQNELDALRNQISTTVGAAQFNGRNLIDGSTTTTNTNGNAGMDVLASLDRDASGNVTSSSIGVDTQNLSLSAGTALAAAAASVGTDPGVANVIDANDGGTNDNIILDTFAFLDNAGGTTGTSALKSNTAGVDTTQTGGLVVGDQLTMTVGSVKAQYMIKEGDTATSIVGGMKNALISAGLDTTKFTLDVTTAGKLKITNKTNAAVSYSFAASRGTGGLADLATMDISTAAGASSALSKIENVIQTAIKASAAFGAAQNRIKTQSDFVSKLMNSMKEGIGSLVDANMEEASARLQALQVQQQLSTQALSIANKAPRNVLALFR